MQWHELICDTVLVKDRYSEPWEWEKYSISPFEKDYKKIIASSAFRRLQDKTQVFPLDKSDFVRTRLTHSIEVSTVAKQLGVMVCKGYNSYAKKEEKENFPMEETDAQSICDILMCAGLLHDLGNPPFGHFGETVIGDWFKHSFSKKGFAFNGKAISNILTKQMQKDLEHFEGNAQSLRILFKSCNEGSASDLNLTYSVMHTLMKYPTSSLQFDPWDEDTKKHKNGFFLAEEEMIQKIVKKTKTRKDGRMNRHPLTLLLEAADDIAYATADLEDAFKKNLFSLDQFISFYDSEIAFFTGTVQKEVSTKASELIQILREAVQRTPRTMETDATAFNEWVKMARGWLMYIAAFGFIKNYTSIMEGTFKNDLFYDTFHEFSVIALKHAMARFAYDSDGIVKLELSAQTIITFLLDKFVPAVLYYDEVDAENRDKQSAADRKHMALISENFKNDYKACKRDGAQEYNLYLRFLLVTDYISGMTDSFAKNLYQELNGIM